MKLRLTDINTEAATEGQVPTIDSEGKLVYADQAGGGGGGGGGGATVKSNQWRVLLPTGATAPFGYAGFGEIVFADGFGVQLATGGTPTASSRFASDWDVSQAFNGNAGGQGWLAGQAPAGSWAQYQFATPIWPEKVVLYPNAGLLDSWPTQVAIQYWDGASWVTVFSGPTASPIANAGQEYAIPAAPTAPAEKPGWRLMAQWSFAANGAISVLPFALDGVDSLFILATDITKAAAGWIGGDFSYDGGVTWVSGALDYSKTWASDGNVGVAGTGSDPRWYMHSGAANQARSIWAEARGLSRPGLKLLRSPRTASEVCLNRNVPTHFRLAAILTTSDSNTQFTGGSISIFGL